MDRDRNFISGAYNEERYRNYGFSRNEELQGDRNRGRAYGQYETNDQGTQDRNYGDDQVSVQRDYQRGQNGYHDRYGRKRDDPLMDARYAIDDNRRTEEHSRPADRDGYSIHDVQSRQWLENDIKCNDDPNPHVQQKRDGDEYFDDISYHYQPQEQAQHHRFGRDSDPRTRQYQPERNTNFQRDSPPDLPHFNNTPGLGDRHEQVDYRSNPDETRYSRNDNQGTRDRVPGGRQDFEMQSFRHDHVPEIEIVADYAESEHNIVDTNSKNHEEIYSSIYLKDDTPDYENPHVGNSVHTNADRPGKYGHSNDAYYADVEHEKNRTPRLSRAVSQRSRKKRSRRERRQDIEDEIPVPFVDGMKTLIQRRKTLRARRPLSELGAKSELGRMSAFIDSQFDFDGDDDEEDKLPSNRNLKKTKTLKQRLNTLHRERPGTVSVHDMAAALRDQVLMQEPSKLKGLNLMKYKWSMNWLHFKNWCKNVIYEFELWSGAFKLIEGHFGTSTVSYFRFLRWLMFLNIFMSVFMLAIVMLPFLLLPPQGHGSFNSSVNECTSNFHYQAVYLSANYTSTVQESVEKSSVGQKIRDVLQGTGVLENTVLFYGSYYNKTGFIPKDNPAQYNMALAYLCAVGVSFLLSFVLLVKNSAKGLKVVSVSSGSVSMYCNKVFGAWDFCISQQNTAKLKHKSIVQEVKNELEYQRFQWKRESRTTQEKLKLYLIRFAINILVIAILGGALFLIYFTNTQIVVILQNASLSSAVVLIVQFLPSITLMLLSVVVPTIFNKLVVAEDYMPAFAIRITLFRVVLLRLASLGMLMVSLYLSLSKNTPSTEVFSNSCDNLQPTIITTTATTSHNETDPTKSENHVIHCWETYVGQQIYKLVVLNFLVVIGSTLCWEFPRKLIYTKFHEKLKVVALLGQQTFDLSKSVLDLVYLQTLCWLGMFFSPILPLISAVTLFIFFYLKKKSLLTNCLPQQQYGTTKSNSLFMMVLLLSFFLAAIPITYMIGGMRPSQECGPFRVYSSDAYIMFDVVSNLVLSFDGVQDVFYYISDSRTMVAIGFFFCLLMYYFWMVGQANYNLSKSLREQLKVEGQDKQFLVARVNEALAAQ